MSTIKNAALLAVCLAVGTVTAETAQAEYGHWGYKGGHHGYKHGWYKNFQKVPMGAVINLKGSYGVKPGEAFLYFHGKKFNVKVIAWTPKSVKLVMPVMKLSDYNYAKLMLFGKHAYKHGYKYGYGYKHGYMVGCFHVELLPPIVKKGVPAKGGVAPKAGGVGGAVAPKAGGAGTGAAGAGAGANTSAPAGEGVGQSLEQQLIVVETPAADKAPAKPAAVKEAKAPAGAPDDLK